MEFLAVSIFPPPFPQRVKVSFEQCTNGIRLHAPLAHHSVAEASSKNKGKNKQDSPTHTTQPLDTAELRYDSPITPTTQTNHQTSVPNETRRRPKTTQQRPSHPSFRARRGIQKHRTIAREKQDPLTHKKLLLDTALLRYDYH